MAKKKKTRGVIDGLIAAYEETERNSRSREWINPESYEEGSDPNYGAWKNVEQGRRMKRDIVRLQNDEKENYPKIIEAQNTYIQLLEDYLAKDEIYIKDLRAFYDQQLKEYKRNYDEIEARIRSIEKQTTTLINDVNKNTARIEELIKELNEEKARVGELARKACDEVVEKYNSIMGGRVCSKFCYYKIRGVEFIISKFSEPKITMDALYALAIDALGGIAEIESQSELEWKKFHPIYESFKSEISEFIEVLEKHTRVRFDEFEEAIIDLDFWTDNRFSNLVANARQLNQKVYNGEFAQDYVMSELKIDEELLTKFKEELDELTVDARNRASHAFRRQALALSAVDCLENNHCFLTSMCQFEEGDQRGPFVIEAECGIEEVKITLVFTPEGRDEEAWCFLQHDKYIDPNQYEALVKEITLSLKDECGIICIRNDETDAFFVKYNEGPLTEDGKLSESINKIIHHQNI